MKLSASTMKPTDLTLRELALAYFRSNENDSESPRQQELREKIKKAVMDAKNKKD